MSENLVKYRVVIYDIYGKVYFKGYVDFLPEFKNELLNNSTHDFNFDKNKYYSYTTDYSTFSTYTKINEMFLKIFEKNTYLISKLLEFKVSIILEFTECDYLNDLNIKSYVGIETDLKISKYLENDLVNYKINVKHIEKFTLEGYDENSLYRIETEYERKFK